MREKSTSLHTGKEFLIILEGTAQQVTGRGTPLEVAWSLVRVYDPPKI